MVTRVLRGLIVLFVFPLSIHSEYESQFKHVRMENKEFIFYKNDTLQIEKNLEKHNSIINAIDSVSIMDYNEFQKLEQTCITSQVFKDKEGPVLWVTKYKERKSIGIAKYEFREDNSVYEIHYSYDNMSIPSDEVLEMLLKTNADFSEYPVVPETVAVQRAVNFLNTIMGVDKAAMFDSMEVIKDTTKGYNNLSYTIKYFIKVKNDIIDGRFATVTLGAFDGNIVSYKGANPELNKEDYNYKSKVPKQAVSDMFLSECSKLNINVEISKIVLRKFYPEIPVRWHWSIYRFNKAKPRSVALLLLVDSETGEVLEKRIK